MTGGPTPDPPRSERLVLDALTAGATRPGEISEATGLPARTVSAALGGLRARELVAGRQRALVLTAAGRRATARPGLPGADAYDALTRDVLPLPLAAMSRLVADAVVFRHYEPHRERQPAFVAFGPPDSGKGATVQVICAGFGFTPGEATLSLPASAPGEVLGRRRQVPGTGWVLEPAEHLGRPFVCVDELDKAEPEARRAVFSLVADSPLLRVEGTEILLRATVLVTFNATPVAGDGPGLPRAALHEAHYRRAVTCYTGALTPSERAGIGPAMRALDLSNDGPLLDLDDLRPPVGRLPADCYGILEATCGASGPLLEQARHLLSPARLECLALGRAARWRATSEQGIRAATAAALYDVLTTWDTVPGVLAPGWEPDDDEAWERWLSGEPGAEVFFGATKLLRGRRSEITRAVLLTRERRSVAHLELTGERAGLRAELDLARRLLERVPAEHKAEAAKLRAQLGELKKLVVDANSLEALGVLEGMGAPLRADADGLRRRLDEERVERERLAGALASTRRAEAERAKEGARRQRDAERAATARRNGKLREVHKRQGELQRLLARKTTKPGEDVARILVGLNALASASREQVITVSPLPGARAVARWRGRTESGARQRITFVLEYLDHAGRSWRTGELGTWKSRGTIAALNAGLLVLADQEANLRAGLELALVGLPPPVGSASGVHARYTSPRDALGRWP